MDRVWIGLGALAGVSAVAMAAVAAHGLPGRLDAAALAMVQQAVQMQGWHALALLFCGMWARRGGVLAHLAGAAFALGLLLFCGAVYLLTLTGVRLPMVAPTGGTVLMLGWILVGLSALRWSRRDA
jgi:uncharacterized membrane protein YgdD (TMEM256/DUF423 family)